MNKIKQILTLCLTVACAACSSEAPMIDDNTCQNDQTENKCRMILDAEKPTFEGSRADNPWQNGDIVYLQFVKPDNTYIYGKAVYSSASNGWELTYTGVLTSAANANCYAYYFEGPQSVSNEKVTISPATCVYYDSGTYTMSGGSVLVSCNLTPYNGRVRFTGTPGHKFTVSGLQMYSEFNPVGSQFATCGSHTATIGNDGSSPYIYMNKSNGADPLLVVSYDKLSFAMQCESPILDRGKSGYMKLPTRDSHAGWSMQETTTPQVGETVVTEVGTNTATFQARIISDGNAPISECGFVYSTKENPTVSDTKLTCYGTTLSATATSLTKNVTYYVRAYATNSEGSQYGAQTSFTTKSGTVEVTNGLSALYLFEGNFDDTTENEYNGFGVSNPSFVAGVNGGKAVKFTKDSYMQVPYVLNETDNHSTAFWIKDPSNGTIYGTIGTTNYPSMHLWLEGGMLVYSADNDGANVKFTHPSIIDGNWHHVVLVTDFNSTTNYSFNTILYIDGKRVAVETEYYGNSRWNKNGRSFQLGGPIKRSSSTMEGSSFTIDNYRAYTRCLTAEEVKTIYNSEKP